MRIGELVGPSEQLAAQQLTVLERRVDLDLGRIQA